jgi:transcriptional regulator with XRE-family HTH domain
VTSQDPLILRRRLRVELRKARNHSGRTQKDVAQALDWSPSKLIRIENGSVGVTTTDLRALLDAYDVRDPLRIDELIQMARRARGQSWTAYSDVLSKGFLTYLGYESSAATSYQFQPDLVPGLLQTEEYARAVLRDVGKVHPRQEDRLWAVRQQRQELHERESPPHLIFLLDEAVIRRWLGGQGVMWRQLQRLREFAELPHISLQMIPFSAGGHTGMNGPIIILQFADPEIDDLVYLEGPRGGSVFLDDPDATSRYLDEFLALQDLAMTTNDTTAFLDKITNELPVGADADQPQKDPAIE